MTYGIDQKQMFVVVAGHGKLLTKKPPVYPRVRITLEPSKARPRDLFQNGSHPHTAHPKRWRAPATAALPMKIKNKRRCRGRAAARPAVPAARAPPVERSSAATSLRRAAGARRRPRLHEVAAETPGGAAQFVCAKPYYFLCGGAQRAKWSGKRNIILRF